MKKKFFSLALALALCLSLPIMTASAAGFSRSRTYSGQFTDIPADAWYANAVKDCYELGLMSGNSDTTFNPSGLFTLAEASSIAARMHDIYNGGSGTIPSSGSTWYQGSVDYCIRNGIIRAGQFSNYERSVNRAEMAYLMVSALPQSAWTPINSVSALPDVSASTDYSREIFTLYNAGVLSGKDEYGMFNPYAYVTRAEVAVIVSNCATPSQRVQKTLKPLSERIAPEIPGTISASDYKVSCGLMLIRDASTKLYGYMNTAGSVSIPAQYKEARDFSPFGYARVRDGSGWGLINTNGTPVIPTSYYSMDDLGNGGYKAKMKSGKLCLIVNGSVKTDHVYDRIDSNGIYYFAKTSTGTYDVYDISGRKLNSFSTELKWTEGNTLFSVKSGNKWAAATSSNIITDYLYDSIDLYKNSTLAVLKYGEQRGLVGESGVVLNLGEYVFKDPWSGEEVLGGYAVAYNGQKYALANETGIISDFFESSDDPYLARSYTHSNAVLLGKWNRYYPWAMVYDVEHAKTYIPVGGKPDEGYAKLEDGTFILSDGTWCQNVASVGKDYQTFMVNGKYGAAYFGDTVAEPIYSSSDEAIAAYGYYKIDKQDGKPVVVYGNEVSGFNTYAIRYYKNSMYYDEIKEVGEGYYACRYNTTWYLLHA